MKIFWLIIGVFTILISMEIGILTFMASDQDDGFTQDYGYWYSAPNGRYHVYLTDFENGTAYFPWCEHTNSYLHGDWKAASNVTLPPSITIENQINVIVDAYWDGTYYISEDDGKQYKTLMPIYGNRTLIYGHAWATINNNVIVNLED